MAGYSVVTFGCQMNQHDSERLSEVLSGAGYSVAKAVEEASLIVLNTCSVREKAEQKLRSEVGRLALLKRDRPELVLVVAGCVAQQEGERLLRGMPSVDVVLGPDNIRELPELLAEVELGAPPRVRTVFDVDAPEFLRANPAPGKAGASAFVTTMKGCNERCSFCIVPTTRGPERYRPSSEILGEVQRLTRAGVREVTLLGQTVNSYRDPERALANAPGFSEAALPPTRAEAGDETEFPALLRAIADGAPELRRLRYTSPHPRHLTPALARAHADVSVLARHVHMPVQSGSDRILKRMIRRYTVEEYVDRVTMLRDAVPGLTLSTDVIVGFPGETRDDFERTLDLVRRVGFVGVFGFKYSVRPYTPAKNLVDDVDEPEKSKRLAELFTLVEAERRRHLDGLVGTEQQVLIEGPSKGGLMTGRTDRNEIVHVGLPSESRGEIVRVRISRAYKNSLAAEPAVGGWSPSRLGSAEPFRRTLPVV